MPISKLKKAICATVKRKRKGWPKEYYFNTQIQSEVELAMSHIGYGCDQYYLSFGYTAKDIQASKTPCRRSTVLKISKLLRKRQNDGML